jgi:hypothetical protein
MSRKTLLLIRVGIWFTAFLFWVAYPINYGLRDGWGASVDYYKFSIYETFTTSLDGFGKAYFILSGLSNWALLAAAVAFAFVSNSSLNTPSFNAGVDSSMPPGITGTQVVSFYPKSAWLWVANVVLWFNFLFLWIAGPLLWMQTMQMSAFGEIKNNIYGHLKYAIVDSESGLGTRVIGGLYAVSTWIITAVAIYLLVAVFKPKPLVAPVNNVQYSVPPGILD